MDPNLPLGNVRTIEELFDNAVAPQRLSMWLLGSFALLAVILAVLGIYGVISYSVAQRTREIGVRIALGAIPSQVISLVVGQGMRIVIAGVVLGLGLSFAAGQALSGMLFEVAPGDTPTTIVCVAIFLTIAGLALIAPSWRAAKVDPIAAIRSE